MTFVHRKPVHEPFKRLATGGKEGIKSWIRLHFSPCWVFIRLMKESLRGIQRIIISEGCWHWSHLPLLSGTELKVSLSCKDKVGCLLAIQGLKVLRSPEPITNDSRGQMSFELDRNFVPHREKNSVNKIRRKRSSALIDEQRNQLPRDAPAKAVNESLAKQNKQVFKWKKQWEKRGWWRHCSIWVASVLNLKEADDCPFTIACLIFT